MQVVHTGYPMGYPLERARHLLAQRRLANAGRVPGQEPSTGTDSDEAAAATEQSSSLLQPPRWSGALTRAASAPGRWAQARRPDRGTGLVLIARAPT